MILYCIVAKTFIFDLFVAAVVPALLAIALNLFAIAIVVRIDPRAAPPSARLTRDERWRALKPAWPMLLLMFSVFGGLYSGVFTVNEAASVAAVLTLAVGLAHRRLDWPAVWIGLRETASTTAMLYIIIIGATVFTYFVTLARIPEALIEAVGRLDMPPIAIIFALLIVYLVLGAVFDEISAMLITLPFVLPIIEKLGYDAVWWGIINVVIIELGMIIPPIGLIVFLLHGLAPQIPILSLWLPRFLAP
jgi:tripartite ATP-independent transporter DctM subunit